MLKLLVVDDEPAICEIFADMFSDEFVEIKTTSDPQVAMQLAKTFLPDAIFLDFRMPLISGDQLAGLLNPATPKYLLTGEIDPQTKYAFSGILKKPIEFEKVEKLIKNLRKGA